MEKHFAKYQIELTGVTEPEFMKLFADHNEWSGIVLEENFYGIESFGVSNDDFMVIDGRIIANSKAEARGMLSGMKTWLKRIYGCKKPRDLVIIYGTMRRPGNARS